MRLNGYLKAAVINSITGSGEKPVNNYVKLGKIYNTSHLKPDKKFSHLPTILSLVGKCRGKEILELGCGDGFYTREIAVLGPQKVYALDNSPSQIERAREICGDFSIGFLVADMFKNEFPKVDLIVAPYVANYAANMIVLTELLKRMYRALKKGGRIILLVDMPDEEAKSVYGAKKKFLGPKVDGTRIQIDLFNLEDHICTLQSVYFSKQTFELALRVAGFQNIAWHEPIIARDELFGSEFWEHYLEHPDVAYLTAEK